MNQQQKPNAGTSGDSSPSRKLKRKTRGLGNHFHHSSAGCPTKKRCRLLHMAKRTMYIYMYINKNNHIFILHI